MKYATTTVLILLMLFCYVRYVRGEVEEMDAEQITIIASEVPERTVTISQEWEVNMSASVPANSCNTCLKYTAPSNCLEECESVIIYD